MPNGRPGNHPLSDLIYHNIPLYGGESDKLIKTIVHNDKENN